MPQSRLDQARRLLALAQTGLHYTSGTFDRERYEEIAKIAHAQIAELASITTGEVAEMFAYESGYANPKLDVRCAVFNEENKILLVRETADGRWSLPGGWADIGLSPAENAAKEAREESGYSVNIIRLMAVWDTTRHGHPKSVFQIWKLVFLAEVVGVGQTVGVETDDVGFFDAEQLPPLSLGRVLPEQIQRLYALRRSGTTEFD